MEESGTGNLMGAEDLPLVSRKLRCMEIYLDLGVCWGWQLLALLHRFLSILLFGLLQRNGL